MILDIKIKSLLAIFVILFFSVICYRTLSGSPIWSDGSLTGTENNLSGNNSHSVAFTSDNKEEILIVVKDQTGEDNYTKVIVKDKKNNVVINPSRRLGPGWYHVMASSHHNSLCNQNIRIESF